MDRFIDTKRSGVRGQGSEIRTEKSPRDILSPLPSRLSPSSGFSLVELLVVITIIGMLVGLLMPALISARGRARIAQCTNNQKELGLAIIQYEGAKQKLPGYANTVNGTAVSWIPVLFPYLGRMDLWEGSSTTDPSGYGWRRGSNAGDLVKTRLAQVVCPNGSPSSTSNNYDTPLSYVVNVGLTVPADTLLTGASAAVFRYLYSATGNAASYSITLSSIKSSGRRPMISERNCILDSSGSNTTANRSWSDTSNVTAVRLGFIWPGSTTVGQYPLNGTAAVGSYTFSSGYLPAIHQGVVIVTFCDGHVESLADNTDCSTFDYSAF